MAIVKKKIDLKRNNKREKEKSKEGRRSGERRKERRMEEESDHGGRDHDLNISERRTHYRYAYSSSRCAG